MSGGLYLGNGLSLRDTTWAQLYISTRPARLTTRDVQFATICVSITRQSLRAAGLYVMLSSRRGPSIGRSLAS